MMRYARGALSLIKDAGFSFADDDGLSMSAALAFYVSLAFAPTIVLALWLAASLGEAAKNQLLAELDALGGVNVRAAAQLIIDNAQGVPTLGSIAGVIGIATLLIGASAVFSQLQSSLNIIWRIEGNSRNVLWTWLRNRLLSFGTLAATAFVLIVSLVVSTLLSWLFAEQKMAWQLLNQAITFLVFVTLFSALFRYLPDRALRWRDTFRGALMTAALFMLGKFLIGQYLAHSNVGGAYGSAGSFVVLLVWVYYSSAVFFFGAELVGTLDRRSTQAVTTGSLSHAPAAHVPDSTGVAQSVNG